jgi:hypothetical protein
MDDGVMRARAACRQAGALLDALALGGEPIEPHAAALLDLVEQHGTAEVDRAIAIVLRRAEPSIAKLASLVEERMNEMLARFEQVVKAVKNAMRYRGSYATGDILAALVARWIDSGELAKLQALPPGDRRIGTSVRNFLLDRLGVDKVLAAARKRIAEKAKLQIIDESELLAQARAFRKPVLVDEASGPRSFAGKLIMLHRFEPANRKEAVALVRELGGSIAPAPSGEHKLGEILDQLDLLVVGTAGPGEKVELPDEPALERLVADEAMSAWLRGQATALALGDVDARIELPPREPTIVGAVLLKTIRGLTQREIVAELSRELGRPVSLTYVHQRHAEGEDYLVALRCLEESSDDQ